MREVPRPLKSGFSRGLIAGLLPTETALSDYVQRDELGKEELR
jgi:hypothetical protein